MDIPGVVNEKVQIIANKKTIKNWKFSCIQAGAIEGITATSPQGVTYTFTEPKLIPTTSLTALNAFGNWELVPKYHAFLLLTQMADRFGNTVTYSYSQGQLTQISSNDGRVISLTYENNPYGKARVKTVTANGRSWNYSYTNATNPHNIDYLTTVQRPDQKSWSYNLSTVNRGSAGIATDRVFYYNIGGGGESSYTITNASETQCIQPSYAPIQSASITHPNGAQLALEFKTTLFGRSEVPKIQSHLSYPVHTHDLCFLANSVTKKTLSQAGLPSMVWAYSYSQNTGKWAGVAGDQTLTGLYSTPTGYNLVDLRATRVTAPDGSKTAHIFSRKWDVTDGQEVATEYYDTNGTTILKRIERSFAGQSTGGNAELFSFTGFENGAQYDFENEAPHENYVNKTKETVFQYNGSAADSFITQYSNFNSYGVPQTIAESTSTHATTRTTTVGYQHDTTNWVLNLETNRQRVQGGQSVSLSSATYYGATETGKSMPKTQSSFGQLQQTHTYDTTGLLTRTDYPISNRWVQYSSYKRGQPQTITLPGRMNAATTISASQAVDNNGWVTSTTDLNGNVTSYGYDGLGRLTLIDPTDSRWSNTTITYDTDYSGIGALQQNITRGNFRKTVYLDGLMRPVLTQEWDSADSVATTRYTKRQFNAYGKELFVSRPSVSSSETYGSTTVFDGLQRPKSVTNTATGDISYSYQTGNQTIITNGRGYTTSTAYQAFGSPDSSLAKTISQPESATTTIAYNAADLPTSITQGGMTESRVYNGLQQLCLQKRPDTGVTVYTYNVLGQVTGMAEGLTGTGSTCTNYTNTASAWSTHSYDNLGALSSISYADGSPAKSYTLDPQGNVTRLSSGSGSGAAVWDYTYNSAHLVETEILTVDNQSWPLDPSYNGLGHLTSLVYPSGTSVSYAPNALGQAKQAGTYATNAAYHPNGQLKSFSYGNGLTFTQSLDGEYRPYEREVKSGSTLRVGQRYNYDANDNLNAITDLMNSSKNLSLGFDGLDRLTTANGYWGNGSLSYNQVGNITGKTLGTQALTYAYDTNNRLTSVTGGYSFSYDGRGTVTNNGKRTFTVNSANQMTGSGAISYVYDGHNRRVKKVNGSSIQYSLYDQGGTFLSTTGTNGPTEHIYLGSQLVARISQVVTADDKPGYTGHLEDKDIGLTYMQQRYYDPVIGRFYSNDPVGFTPSNPMMFNRYAYANNNPYKFVDPDGRNGVVAGRVPLFIPTKQQNHDATSTVPNQIRGDVGSRGEPRTSRGDNRVHNEASDDTGGVEPQETESINEPTSEAPYPNNPGNSEFDRINGGKGAKQNPDDGSVWEKDTSQHGGEQWKRWPDKRSWEKGEKPNSIWPDGRIRK